MMKRLFSICSSFAVLFSSYVLEGASFPILKEGKPSFEIVQADNDPIMRHAAENLARYTGKIGKNIPPAIVKKAGTKPVILLTTDIKQLSGKEKDFAAKVKKEGFLLSFDAKGKRSVIYGKDPMGVLYGVNTFLRRYGKIRFLTPGEDGTYISRKDDLSISPMLKVENPAFAIRTQILGAVAVNSFLSDTWDWLVNNNMQITGNSTNLSPAAKKYFAERGGKYRHGGHAFDQLMTGAWITKTGQKAREDLKILQKEHPEYFPIIRKQRKFGRFAQYNPCVAAEGLAERMTENLMTWQEKHHSGNHCFIVGNNDVTSWCECEKCDTFDPVPRFRARIKVPNRYWYFVNKITSPVLDKYPDADLWGWAYQNFNMVPDKHKPDPRLSVMLVYNRHCMRHDFTDKNCPVNSSIYGMMKEWKKIPNIQATWDQVEDALSIFYLPMGKAYADRIKEYKLLGLDGVFIGNYPPDGNYPAKHNKRPVHTRYTWKMNWMGLYAASVLLWNPEADYDLLMEEAGSLYYGKGWKEGMKEYHILREKAFRNAAGCFGWGHDGSDPARLIASPFVAEKLEGLLNKARKAASGDVRSRKHIEEEMLFFRKKYKEVRAENERKLTSFALFLTGEKVIADGFTKEKFWKNAEEISCFAPENGKNPEKTPLVSIRGAAGKDNRIVFALSWKKDDNIAKIDLILDGRKEGETSVISSGKKQACSAIKEKNGINTWEIILPSCKLNTPVFSGARIFMDVCVTTKDGRKYLLSAGGRNNYNGRTLWTVYDLRRTSPDGTERNIAGWSNGSLDETRPRPEKSGKWEFPEKISPKFWQVQDNEPGKLIMPFHEGSTQNRYVKLFYGCILNRFDCSGKELEFRFSAKVSGPGRVQFDVIRHDLSGKRAGTVKLVEYRGDKLDSRKWHKIEFNFKRNAPGEFCWIFVRNFHKERKEVLVDDIQIVPVK